MRFPKKKQEDFRPEKALEHVRYVEAWYMKAKPTSIVATMIVTLLSGKIKDHVFEKADRFTERQKEKEAQAAKTEKAGKEQPDQKPKTKKHDMEL